MKILHLADLHIGKKVNDFCMLKEQKNALLQAIELIKKENIGAVLIAGDVFDRAIPAIAALELFEEFLNNLNKLSIKTYIISGNHDNMERLSYMSKLLESSNIFFNPTFSGKISPIELNENIDIYLLPYLYPALVKKFYPNIEIKNHNDAIKTIINNIEINNNKFNIILSHQFVTGSKETILSDSEQKSVGGIDEVNYLIYEKFDYCALGHLHCPQKCGIDKIRYAGSILKYSFSEINQVKKFIVLDVKSANELKIEFHPIKFLHEMKQYRGYIDDFLSKDFYENIDTHDYIHFTLLDEQVLDAKKKLSLIYPNIMLLEFDNSFTKNMNNLINCKNIKDKTIYEHFCDFYYNQTNSKLDENKKDIVIKMLNKEIG